MREVVDHLGRKTQLKDRVERLVSLCPSQTETIISLGAKERLVGVTRFCIAPHQETKNIPKVGGTKEVNFEKIRALKPDLFIAEKEENTEAMVLELEKIAPVFVTDVCDFGSSLAMINDLGICLQLEDQAGKLVEHVRSAFFKYQPRLVGKSVLYFIWQNPWMVAGEGTFIGDMLRQMGLRNVAGDKMGRYPELKKEDMRNYKPDFVFLSSEPFPFREKQLEDFRTLFPFGTVQLVDGELFSWYGARMTEMPNYFMQLEELLLDS